MVNTEILTEQAIVKQFWKLVDLRDELYDDGNNRNGEDYIQSNNQVDEFVDKHWSVLKGKF